MARNRSKQCHAFGRRTSMGGASKQHPGVIAFLVGVPNSIVPANGLSISVLSLHRLTVDFAGAENAWYTYQVAIT
jgi:hypothetical protein